MSAQHTPGPWHVDDSGQPTLVSVFGGVNDSLVAQAIVGAGLIRRDAEANARLIAAAPDLLAALKQAVETIKVWHGSIHDADGEAWDIYRQHAPEMKAINAALQQADGAQEIA